MGQQQQRVYGKGGTSMFVNIWGHSKAKKLGAERQVNVELGLEVQEADKNRQK
jgi:hypothetical protein